MAGRSRSRYAANKLFAMTMVVLASACRDAYHDIGSYRVVQADDNFFGFRCQVRQEFYFLPTQGNGKPTYLGTCGAPRFVTRDMNIPTDRSCYAIAEDGTSMVYRHRPQLCGAGRQAEQKIGGIYAHSVADGDRLIYPDSLIDLTWTREGADRNAIRIGWRGLSPSRGGATCGQTVFLYPDGTEVPIGAPDSTIRKCREARS